MDERDTSINEQAERLLYLHAQDRRVRNLNLAGSSLIGINLDKLEGDGIRLRGANLKNSTLQKARFVDCDFSGANLSGANLSEATFRMCTLDGVHASSALCEGSRIEDSSIQGADFSKANLRRSRVTESSWTRSLLRGANLEEIQGDGVVFRGADLREASLIRAQLKDADFRGADLSGANLSGGNFKGADFRGAILDNILFEGTEFAGAHFDQESQDVKFKLRVSDQMSVSEEVHLDAVRTSMIGSGDSDAVATALVQLILNTISSSARGTLRIDQDVRKVEAEWQSWRSRVGEADPEEMHELLESMELALGSSGVLSPEATKSFTSILHAIENSSNLEPSEEWKVCLKKLFPELDETEDEATLDTLASTLMAMFWEEKSDKT